MMKRVVLFLLAAMAVMAAVAQRNVMYIEVFEIEPGGHIEVPLMMANSDSTRGCQLNMSFPEGLRLTNYSLTSYTQDGYGMERFGNYKNGVWTIGMYPMERVCLPPADTAIMVLSISATADFTGGKIVLYRQRGSTIDNKSIFFDNDTTVVITADVEEYCVMLPCDSYMPAKVRVGNVVSSKRVLLYDMEVLSGNDYTPLDYNKAVYYEGITEKSLELNNVKPMSYALSVKATYADGTESDWSNMVRVNINWATGDVNHDGEINIADVNATLDLIMGGHISASSVANNDVNGDGEVNIADVNAIIDRIMQ